ncbi:RimJ/RimL family protein N-acetyltransferase [Dysgonomonas sp. PFB1-18]|uniref:GNAT family N-acetyltransferase n=1 Tax=unclassified Dysgonomonas TaxID=2630389 RepID=UPI002475AADA|nr:MULTISPECIES: GNAT family N-acetyltransferase [unclassified Dysgonomonas]MDH6307332.1 RimJ/RimL family protein N-acetyltransferase [Dysgonomonas sp. PF1-14]MDH6337250.1 RimJ/RimL family protein N-acetyltransferase [Dysgonomonas sp. PF1-16]MDH6379174.1 RimJ/RimL family protein N-acetyltransferase [Dysgonomonas sp. PFB1-18]MDH6396188.1 RimJ/RimL family protein N-acetyltransferase [Dysgonomonas sp. PF1-23]
MNEISINSEKILLRNIQETDIDAIYPYRSLPEIAKYQYWEPFTLERTTDFVNQCIEAYYNSVGQWIGLAIKYKGNLIGDCAFNISDGILEIGCNISPDYQGKGFAKGALNLLISDCYKRFHINEIIGITDSRNTASIRLMESLGMNRDNDFENHIICKGEDCIEYKYSGKR